MTQVGEPAKFHDPIPETVDDALAKWDAGEPVFSVEMGGIGPGYEQCIQVVAFELMRELRGVDLESPGAHGRADSVAHALSPKLGGMSCAQVGAAMNLASNFLRKGYRAALRELPDERLIQVSKNFPRA
jgi:hypothetical protein